MRLPSCSSARLGPGASTIGWQVEVVYASTKDEVDAAFGRLGRHRIDAVFISADQFFTGRRVQFATLAALYRVPAIYCIVLLQKSAD